MKISLITLSFNEEVLMPFFIRHYENIVDEIYLFDNCSTDKSVEIASKCKKVKVESFNTGGKLRDDIHMKIKNEFYKKLDADWVIVIDLDEFLWHKDLRQLLEEYLKKGITLPLTIGYNMIGTEVPKDDGVTPLTKFIDMGVRTDCYGYDVGSEFVGSYSKRAVFQKKLDIKYMPGCHECHPTGLIVDDKNPEILLLHYKWLSREHGAGLYSGWTLSPENIKSGFGTIGIETRLSYYDKALTRRQKIPGL